MLGSTQFPQFLQDSLHIIQMALLWSHLAVRPPRPPPNWCSETQIHRQQLRSHTLPSPHTQSLYVINKYSPALLKTTTRALYLSFPMPGGQAVGNLALGKYLERLGGRNSSPYKQEHKEPADRSRRFYGDCSTPLFTELHSY